MGILCLLMRDREFALRHVSMIKPSYFDSDIFMDLARLSIEFFTEVSNRSKLPEKSTVVQMVKDHLRKTPNRKDKFHEYQGVIDEIYCRDLESHDVSFISSRVREFCKIQAFKIAAQESLRLIEMRRYSEVPDVFQKAVVVGEDLSDLPGSHVDGFRERMSRYRDGEEADLADRVPTMIHTMDRMSRGGAGPGELWALMGPSGIGKTRFMVHLGAAAVETGRNVFHVTLEVGKDVLEELYDCRLTSTPHHEMHSLVDHMEERLMEIKEDQTCGELRIKEWGAGEVNVKDIENYMHLMEIEAGFRPDVVLVDYLDLLAPPEGYTRASRYDQVLWTWRIFRSILRKWGIAGWSPSQQRRSSWKEELYSGDEASECIGKYEVSDSWSCLIQTPEEEEADRMRLLWDKFRRNRRRKMINLKVNLSSCFFRDIAREGV